MNKFALAASAALVAMACTSAANATVDNIVLVGIGSSDAYSTDDSTMADFFNFTVPTAGILSAAFSGVPSSSFTSISGGLYKSDVLVTPFEFFINGGGKFGSVAATAVSVGDYSLRFFGAATGVGYGGSVTLSAAPVPEPAAWAMMMIGLGAVGMAMRNRPKNARVAFS